MQHRHNAQPLVPDRLAPIDLSDREVKSLSFVRAVDAARNGDWRGAEFEREYSVATAKRAGLPEPDLHTFNLAPQMLAPQYRDLTVASAAGGGYTVDTKVGGVIDAVRELLRVKRLGAQSLDGLRSNLAYARQSTTSTVIWAPTEATQATETAGYGFGQIVLAPKTATCYTETSRMLRLMAPDLQEFALRREFAATLATTLDAVAVAGSGASGQPTGLLNTAGIGGFTGASLAYAGVLESQTDILTANALGASGEVGYLCRPAVASLLAQRQAFSANEAIWRGPLAAGQVLGCTAYSSMNAPASTLIAGDWSQLLLAEWGPGLEIRVNPYANFQAGITGFSASLTVDVAVLWPTAFSVATGVS